MIKKCVVLIILMISNLYSYEDIFSRDSYTLDKREWYSVKMAKEWLDNDIKSMKGKDGRIIFMFGATMPTVICTPLKTVDIELEAGEKIVDVKSGDTIRWDFDTAISGQSSTAVAHVLVKPSDLGLNTNLTIFTDRRTYHLYIASKKLSWTPYVSFRYKDSLQRTLDNYHKREKIHNSKIKKFKDFNVPDGTTISIDKLDFKYTIDGEADWRPTRIYNDGTKTYIELPLSASKSELPALLVVHNGDKELVNYRFKNNIFIVDKIFNKAILITGVGHHQEKVIVKRGSE